MIKVIDCIIKYCLKYKITSLPVFFIYLYLTRNVRITVIIVKCNFKRLLYT